MDQKDQQNKQTINPQVQFYGAGNQFNLPTVYANVVVAGISASGDIQLTLLVNGRAIQQVIIPLAAAKSLAEALKSGLNDYEVKTNSKILDLNQIAGLLQPK